MPSIHAILHPTDFSERSLGAFAIARSLAWDYGARLVVLHVKASDSIVYGDGLVVPEPAGRREELLARLRHDCPASRGVPTEHALAEGDPASEILRVAGETGCDLVVMATHGRTGLNRILMGSVAEEVVRKSPCPVLTVNGPALSRQAEADRIDAAVPAFEMAGANDF